MSKNMSKISPKKSRYRKHEIFGSLYEILKKMFQRHIQLIICSYSGILQDIMFARSN